MGIFSLIATASASAVPPAWASPAFPPAPRQTAGTPAGPRRVLPSFLVPPRKQLVERGDFLDEIVEPLVRPRQLAQRPHQHRTRPARPQKQRQMRQVAARHDGLGQLVHVSSLSYGR